MAQRIGDTDRFKARKNEYEIKKRILEKYDETIRKLNEAYDDTEYQVRISMDYSNRGDTLLQKARKKRDDARVIAEENRDRGLRRNALN